MESGYFDHNATTPLDPRVFEAMRPWLTERHGNPSSLHRFGQAAREAVEAAREAVAGLIGARPPEVVFTASGTEANNAVLRGVAEGCRPGDRVVVSALEHPSVRRPARHLARRGVEVVEVRPDADGVVRTAAVAAEITPRTRLVALMLASNEIGTLQPVAEVAAACREAGVPVLCDAVQAVGKVAVDVHELGVDYLTLGAHKFHGPPGAGAVWIRKGAAFEGLLLGGNQERRRRAGTENVPALAGFGRAAELAAAELASRSARLAELRDRYEAGLAALPDVVVHGRGAARLPHTSHAAFLGVEAESLLIRLDLAGFAVSTGSACSSGVVEASPALLAMGLARGEALSSLRVSFGVTNRAEEVDAFLAVLTREVERLRQLSPVLSA